MALSLNESPRPDYAFWISTLNIKPHQVPKRVSTLKTADLRKYIRELFVPFLERPLLHWV